MNRLRNPRLYQPARASQYGRIGLVLVCRIFRGLRIAGVQGRKARADTTCGGPAMSDWAILGRSYRCQGRCRVMPVGPAPQMIVVTWGGGIGLACSARSARSVL